MFSIDKDNSDLSMNNAIFIAIDLISQINWFFTWCFQDLNKKTIYNQYNLEIPKLKYYCFPILILDAINLFVKQCKSMIKYLSQTSMKNIYAFLMSICSAFTYTTYRTWYMAFMKIYFEKSLCITLAKLAVLRTFVYMKWMNNFIQIQTMRSKYVINFAMKVCAFSHPKLEIKSSIKDDLLYSNICVV